MTQKDRFADKKLRFETNSATNINEPSSEEDSEEDADIHSLDSIESLSPRFNQDIDAVTTINKNYMNASNSML